jgi:hypothetical protein
MRKDFVNEVARVQRVKRTDLIEKDLILHQLLFDLNHTTIELPNDAVQRSPGQHAASLVHAPSAVGRQQ